MTASQPWRGLCQRPMSAHKEHGHTAKSPHSHRTALRARSPPNLVRTLQALVDAAVVRPTFVTHGWRPAGALSSDSGAYLFVFLTCAGLAHAGVPPTDDGAAAALTEITDGYTLLHTNKVRDRT